MSSESQSQEPAQDEEPAQNEQMPANEDLEEPSTEKPPEEQPKAPDAGDPEPSHEAVGIGVIGRPLVDPE
ncbi:hypothetical protein NQ152_02900 [Microbacterium sp. zg.B48]|uniref:hypothetical protein n=1 Tax=Microbacterium sp. zg.B48 TaxID=2969408 RepID=UPI00214B6370|nr:hypothetical protein [Microbacterium sp. zg.B48]MCR2762452.1 hypothetical protein [Microbacterium sp. zg.B48]